MDAQSRFCSGLYAFHRELLRNLANNPPCLHFPQCTFVVTSDISKICQLRRIQAHQTPVVGTDYVFSCVETGSLLPVDEHRLDINTAEHQKSTGIRFNSVFMLPLTYQVHFFSLYLLIAHHQNSDS